MIVFDTETTGLVLPEVSDPSKQPQIIDLAMVKISPTDGTEIARWESMINPGVPLSSEITKITGYTDEDLACAPTFAEVLPEIARFVLGEWAWLAHNCPFDEAMIKWELARLGALQRFPWPPQQLCTVQLYVPEFGRRAKLTELYLRKLGRKLDQKHTAMADVEALLEIVRHDRLYQLQEQS